MKLNRKKWQEMFKTRKVAETMNEQLGMQRINKWTSLMHRKRRKLRDKINKMLTKQHDCVGHGKMLSITNISGAKHQISTVTKWK